MYVLYARWTLFVTRGVCCVVLRCAVSLCRTEGSESSSPLSSLRIILGCHLKPSRCAPLYKTLLWFPWDKQREGERERERRGWEASPEAPGLSPLSPSGLGGGGHAGIPKDTGAKGLVALLPTSCTHRRGGDAEIYVMVTQSLPLLNSPSPLTARESEGESLGAEGCRCFRRTEVEWSRHNVLFLLF